MSDPEFVDAQHVQLAIYRRSIAHLLQQAAQYGGVAFAPPSTVNGIAEARAAIARIKATLRDTGAAVDDQPEDEATTALLADALAQLAALPLDSIPDITPLPPGSRMPLSRNPLFVGREDDLKTLARTLKRGTTTAIGQVTAATGLGGIGKTNLATEFVHRYGQFFAGGVFWLSFADAASVPAEIAVCGGPGGMNLPGFDTLKFDDQVARVRQEWQSALPRLLVFDNCEDEAPLAAMRPTSGGCRILITSRRAQWNPMLGVETLPLEVFPRIESVALLRKFLPDLPPDDPDLGAIAAELGDLPLALHMAGSFLAKYRRAVSPANYLAQLRRPELLQHRSLQASGLSPTDHVLDVGRSFALSYDRLIADDPTDALAIALLARAACFAPAEPIPHNLLTARLEIAGEEAALQLEDSLARLVDLGLLDPEVDGALRLHRLLAVFVRALTSATTAQDDVEQVLLETARELNNAGYPASLLVLQGHLRAVTDRARVRADVRAADLCSALGYHLNALGDHRAARPYYEQALAIRREVLGERHPDTAKSLNNLGYLLQAQGDLAGARPYYEQALAILREVLGERHPDTASSLNNLGYLLQAQGDLVGARPYYEQALAILREALGERHPDTAKSLNNLGYLLQAQGDLVGARPYYEQALAIRREVLGERHPDTATSLNNLGYLLQAQGDLVGARPYYEQALAICREVLGERHPNTAKSLNNLGYLLQAQGDLVGARPYYEQALAICREVVGEGHPDTAKSLNNLGYLLRAQGDLVGARPYYEQALAICREVVGERHPNTALSLNNLGALLRAQGDLVAARPYYEQALAINREVLGEGHPATATSLNNLGYLLQAQGDLVAARPYFEQALAICEQALGPEHPTTRIIRANLTALDTGQ